MRRLFLGAMLLVLGSASVARAQDSDTTPPALVGLTVTKSVDVTAGPAAINVSMHLTDDLSGVTFTGAASYFYYALQLSSPSGRQMRRLPMSDFTLAADGGTSLDGNWEATLTMPQWSESGDWIIQSIHIEDRAGNAADLDTAALAAMGFDAIINVASVEDLTPPSLEGLTIAPGSVDTSGDAQTATVTMHITDATSGTDFTASNAGIIVWSPDGRFGRSCFAPALDPAGTVQDGTWTAQCWFPRYSQAGTWTMTVTLFDVAGNQISWGSAELSAAGLDSQIEVTSDPSDTTAPVLHTLSFAPTFIDTSSVDVDVTLQAKASDDISGFGAIQMEFVSPSGGQRRLGFAYVVTDGDQLNGTFTGVLTFPQYTEAGTWRLNSIFYYDQVFNYVSVYSPEDVAALGFPTILNVVRASLVGDGTIGPGGGTVIDETFGDRAAVTLPPGAVDEPTDVAIDVLESPLTFPMPVGFAAPGTRFVNISFTPYPHMPFPAPGATIVLPLVNPMPPGECLVLYRVNPATGELEQAVSVSGGPVTGCVNPDGLSATFDGVSRLSVVVALIPDSVPPTVTAPGDITVGPTEAGGARGSASSALAAFLAGGSATDDIDASPVRLSPQVAGADVTNATLFPLGETTVTFRFRDTAQNIGTATAKVTVTPPPDVVPPVVTPPADITVEATQTAGASAGTSASLAAFLGGGTAVDGVDPSPVKLTPQVSGGDVANTTLFGLGTTTVTFRFKDASDNVGSATAIVTVVDTKAPVVSAPASIAIAATESGGARPADSAALAALLAGGSGVDVADASPVRLTPQVGGIDVTPTTLFPLGVTTVTFRFRDAAGNTGTATASVTVSAGTPRLRAAITSQALVSAGVHTVTLTLSNTGTGNARAVTVTALGFKTLSGTGAVSLSGPATPMAIGSVDAGGSTVVTLTLDVPATVKRFSITENGTYTDVKGKKFSFSLSQSLIPKF